MCIRDRSYYFYNIPEAKEDALSREQKFDLFSYPNENIKPTTTRVWNEQTIFIVFSDAGAHSGVINKSRIKSTMKFWKWLNKFSKKSYWINPVPLHEMNDCTAKRLNYVIPMYDMIPDDLNLLIESYDH